MLIVLLKKYPSHLSSPISTAKCWLNSHLTTARGFPIVVELSVSMVVFIRVLAVR